MNRTALTLASAISLAMSSGAVTAEENTVTPTATGPATTAGSTAGQSDSTIGLDQAGQEARSTANVQQDFDALDRNGDGRLTENELNAYGSSAAGKPPTQTGAAGQSNGEELMQRLDEDRNGFVDQEEMLRGYTVGQPVGTPGYGAEPRDDF